MESVRLNRPTRRTSSGVRSVLSVLPGHELVEASDLVVSDAGEHIGEPGLGSTWFIFAVSIRV